MRRNRGVTSISIPMWLVLVTAALMAVRIYLMIEIQGDEAHMNEKWIEASQFDRRKLTDNQLVLYYFTAQWCSPCKTLEKTTLSNPDVGNEINEYFVPVRVEDPDDKMPAAEKLSTRKLESKYDVSTFPYMLATLSDGTAISYKTGYCSAHSMLSFLQDAREKQIYYDARAKLMKNDFAGAGKGMLTWVERSRWRDNYPIYAAIFGALAFDLSGDHASARKILNIAAKHSKIISWPGPAVDYLLGKMSRDDFDKFADYDNKWITEAKTVEAIKAKIDHRDKEYSALVKWILTEGSRDCFSYKWIVEQTKVAPAQPVKKNDKH